MNKVAVVQCLQAEVGELEVTLCLQCLTEHVEVKVSQIRRQQLELNTALDIGFECLRVVRIHVRLRG